MAAKTTTYYSYSNQTGATLNGTDDSEKFMLYYGTQKPVAVLGGGSDSVTIYSDDTPTIISGGGENKITVVGGASVSIGGDDGSGSIYLKQGNRGASNGVAAASATGNITVNAGKNCPYRRYIRLSQWYCILEKTTGTGREVCGNASRIFMRN